MKGMDLGRLGIPGLVGVGLLLFGISFYASTIAPADVTLEESRQTQVRLEQRATAAAIEKRDEHPGITNVPVLPPAVEATKLIKALHEAAETAGFPIDHLSYRMSSTPGVQRYEISLPLKGPYSDIRHFLDTALTLSVPATLDDIELHRSSAVDPKVDVQAHLSYYFAP